MPQSKKRAVSRKADSTRPRVAVSVRAHFLCEKLLDLVDILNSGVGYQFFVFADETRGPLDLGRVPADRVVRYSTQTCAELGLLGTFEDDPVLWYFSDYPFYCALHLIPGFDYYIMIDYDVEFVRGNAYALESLIARLGTSAAPSFDLIAPQFGTRPAEWFWSQACKGVFPKCYGVFFPIVVLSRRAAEFLCQWRRSEAATRPKNGQYIFCEALVPSALVANRGFQCADLNKVLPGSSHPATFRVRPPMLLGRLPELDRSIEFVHPVYSPKEYEECDLSNPHELPMSPDLPS